MCYTFGLFFYGGGGGVCLSQRGIDDVKVGQSYLDRLEPQGHFLA